MQFEKLFEERLMNAYTIANYTRSSRNLIPLHSAISKYIEEHSDYETQDMTTHEYVYENEFGSKKVDIAIFDKEKNLKGVILFKSICSSYNKNANNYYENMKGESSLFIDGNIPVYQIVFIPTIVPIGGRFEVASKTAFNHYSNFINNKTSYWDLLQLNVFYFDADYEAKTCKYSTSVNIPNHPATLSEGLSQFLERIK